MTLLQLALAFPDEWDAVMTAEQERDMQMYYDYISRDLECATSLYIAEIAYTSEGMVDNE